MIDGESSKAELLQKVFIWIYDCSYSDAYLIKISLDLTLKQQLKLNTCTITLKDKIRHVDCVRQV